VRHSHAKKWRRMLQASSSGRSASEGWTCTQLGSMAAKVSMHASRLDLILQCIPSLAAPRNATSTEFHWRGLAFWVTRLAA
jgi:hypothetical protein